MDGTTRISKQHKEGQPILAQNTLAERWDCKTRKTRTLIQHKPKPSNNGQQQTLNPTSWLMCDTPCEFLQERWTATPQTPKEHTANGLMTPGSLIEPKRKTATLKTMRLMRERQYKNDEPQNPNPKSKERTTNPSLRGLMGLMHSKPCKNDGRQNPNLRRTQRQDSKG